jgi:hypothetical protein
MKNKHISTKALQQHKKRFLRFFPKAFRDQRYLDWERQYKMVSHDLWNELLNQKEYASLLRRREFAEIASRALKVESSTKPPFLFSFEKMALRDALREPHGAREFAGSLYELLHGTAPFEERFIEWIVTVSQLPRKQSRVNSWPILTYFPFIAKPDKFIILKPSAMKIAAQELAYDLEYSSQPNVSTYRNLLDMADQVKAAIRDLRPRDYHDVQTFLWVIGSAEYDSLEEQL